MKRVLLLSLCVLVLFGFVGCREKGSVPFENDISEEIIDNSTESQISAEELEKTEITDKSVIDDEKEYMKLYFNETFYSPPFFLLWLYYNLKFICFL